MPQSSFTIGRVTADLVMQTSAKLKNYVRFTIAENIGFGENSRTQYLQVWAWGEDAALLIKSKVKKGSLIWVSGSLELEEYTKQDGISADKRLKIILDRWGYIATGKPKNGDVGDDTALTDEAVPNNPLDICPDGEIDGDRETLPE